MEPADRAPDVTGGRGARWLANSARGLCMGLADLVPGVSGATVALVLGIYPRVVDAVSGAGPAMAGRFRSRRFRRQLLAGARDPGALSDDEDGRDASRVLFLASLALGIASAIAVGSRFLPSLLDQYPAHMKGLFFGLVLASAAIPIRRMKRRGAAAWALGVAAALGAFWLAGLPTPTTGHARGEAVLVLERPAQADTLLTPANTTLWAPRFGGGAPVGYGVANPVVVPAGAAEVRVGVVARVAGAAGNVPAGSVDEAEGPVEVASVVQEAPFAGGQDPRLLYVFVVGVLAISAMSLPGLSGSFVLLAMGLYGYVVDALRSTLYYGDAGAATVVATMIVAMAAGLLTFARVLKRLLAKWPDAVLAVLAGLMLGSLRALWPFHRYLPSGEEAASLPLAGDPATPSVVLVLAAGLAIVLALERVGRRTSCPRQDSNLGPTA